MRLCLSCYRLWPRSALFCGACGRSFGGRLCPSRHLSPANAHVCVQCGKDEMSEPTAGLYLGWLPTLLSGLCLLLAWKWTWHHLAFVYAILLASVNLALRLLVDAGPHAVERLTAQVAGWAVFLTVALHLVPGRKGRDLRQALFGALRRIVQMVCGIVVVQIARRLLAAWRTHGSS